MTQGGRHRAQSRTNRVGRGSADGSTFRIDPEAQVLWRDGVQVQVRPRTWAVLRHLVEHPGVLIAKDDLLDAVWGDVSVTEATLSQSIRELREALNDDAKTPRFIATVHRRGFRFLGGIRIAAGPQNTSAESRRGGPSAGLLVGRSDALDRLHLSLSEACAGTRRLVLVSGEPGIGKTTLAVSFVGSLGSVVAVGRGGCVSELGDVEPFFPILEAIRDLARGPHRAVVTETLRQDAPPWLREMLGLAVASAGPHAGDERASPARMLLKLSRAIEALARETPVVLLLEDLHWADQATLDLLKVLAHGSEASRLLVLATYRPSEAVLRGGRLDRLQSELSRDPRVVRLPLPPLSADDCDSFLRCRFGGALPPDGLATLLHTHTEGNPLFLVTAVDHLRAQGWLQDEDDRLTLRGSLDTLDAALPKSLVALVEHETRGLSPAEARVLEAGSVAGTEFSVQEVAAALESDVEEVERCLEGLASSQRFVRSVGAEPWPDDTVGSRWRFVHALHRRALLDRVSAARLQRWHQRIGERLELGWAARRDEIVTRLATHFEASRDRVRALEYLDEAARVAERRSAPADAKDFLSRTLRQLLERGENRADRTREIQLRVRIATAINAMEGYASAELREHLREAIELCGAPGYERFRFRLGFALVASCLDANDPRVKEHLRALTDQAAALASSSALALCEVLTGVEAILAGRFRDAAHLERFLDAGIRIDEDLYVGSHSSVVVPVWAALRRCALGDAEEARRMSDEALRRARNLPDKLNEAFALYGAAQIAAWDRDRDRLEALALRSAALTREYGYRHWGGMVQFLLRRLQVLQDDRPGGFEALKGLADEVGLCSPRPRAAVCLGLAEAALRERRFGEGFALVEAGIAAIGSGFARSGHSELLRVRAALRRGAGEAPERVREDLEAALAIATQQGAGAYVERVSADLAELAARDVRDPHRLRPPLRIARPRKS